MTCSCLPGSNLLPDIKEWQKRKDFQLSQSILQTWRLRPESGSNLPPSFRLPGKRVLSWAGPGAACSVLDSSTSGLGEVIETKPIEICNPIPKLTGQCAGPKPPASSSSSRGAPLPLGGAAPPCLSPADRGQQGLGKPRLEQPSCGGGIQEQPLSGLQPGKALRSSCPHPLALPSSWVLTAVRSPLEAMSRGMGGKNRLGRRDLISHLRLLSGMTLDYPKPSLGPWACLGDHWLSLPRHMEAWWHQNT